MGTACKVWQEEGVSILARAEARALRGCLVHPAWIQGFQSSPAPRRGRYLCVKLRLVGSSTFQSSPAPRRGRYEIASLEASVTQRFNPRPRRGAGATTVATLVGGYGFVSILARAEARALPAASLNPMT